MSFERNSIPFALILSKIAVVELANWWGVVEYRHRLYVLHHCDAPFGLACGLTFFTTIVLANNFGDAWIQIDLPFPCDIHFKTRRGAATPGSLQVLSTFSEPEWVCLHGEALANQWRDFDLIITHDTADLQYPNAVQLLYWDITTRNLPSTKRFEVSNIFSVGGFWMHLHDPNHTEFFVLGYQVRYELLKRRNEITVPFLLFVSSRNPSWQNPGMVTAGLPTLVNDSRDGLFESMFHICAENITEDNYFTEKILDCFDTYTVPIYKGCANLSAHGLDERGVIRFETVDECIAICNSLTLEDYYSRLPYVHRNRMVARSYENLLVRMRDVILEAYHKKAANAEARG